MVQYLWSTTREREDDNEGWQRRSFLWASSSRGGALRLLPIAALPYTAHDTTTPPPPPPPPTTRHRPRGSPKSRAPSVLPKPRAARAPQTTRRPCSPYRSLLVLPKPRSPASPHHDRSQRDTASRRLYGSPHVLSAHGMGSVQSASTRSVSERVPHGAVRYLTPPPPPPRRDRHANPAASGVDGVLRPRNAPERATAAAPARSEHARDRIRRRRASRRASGASAVGWGVRKRKRRADVRASAGEGRGGRSARTRRGGGRRVRALTRRSSRAAARGA
jgi:hypothetical protein